MSTYILSIAIGPVQDFITAARRTRDLCQGSWLLSECAKAAALYLSQAGATLIFPKVMNPSAELLPDSPHIIVNKLLCRVESGDPKGLAASAQDAAIRRWEAIADTVLRAKARILERAVWDGQVTDVLEFYAAWAKVGPGKAGYAAARACAEELLAARKRTRDFEPAPGGSLHGLPKSSLDGLRESVLKQGLHPLMRIKHGLGKGEHLDCIGAVKRWGAATNFTALSRIALDPWIRAQVAMHRGWMLNADNLGREFAILEDAGLATRAIGNLDPATGRSIYDAFPFDGGLLFPSRLDAELRGWKLAQEKEAGQRRGENSKQDGDAADKPADDPVVLAFESARNIANDLTKDVGPPRPYVAVLHADGDRMGELIEACTTEEQHRAVSGALSDFANGVPRIVREHFGHCVYTGGDDVLALLPLSHALRCARELHDDFGRRLEQGMKGENFDRRIAVPTLSVGLCIGHIMDPMGRLLDRSRAAEKLAKGDSLPEKKQRNGLGIILQPRSGAPVELRQQWDENPDILIETWVRMLVGGELPDRLVYDLARLDRELAIVPEAIPSELVRVLGRKAGRNGAVAEENRKLLLSQIADPRLPRSEIPERLGQLVNQLLIARRLEPFYRWHAVTEAPPAMAPENVPCPP